MKRFLWRLPVSAGCVGLGFVGLTSLTKPPGMAFLYLFGCPAALIPFRERAFPEKRGTKRIITP